MNDSEEIQMIFNETDLNIKTGPFTMDKYQEVKSTLQTGKQVGGSWILSRGAEIL